MNNLKKIFLAVIVALLGLGASAEAKTIAFGIKAGLNVNKLHFSKSALNDLTNSDNSCGWTAGVMTEINLPIVGLGFDAALMYARMNNGKDAVYIPDAETGSVSVEETNLYGKNFLEIPINIKYKISLPVVGSFLSPYIFTGPNFAFRMDKNVKDTWQNLKSRTFQMAWNIGIGIEFVKHLQVGASYGFGCNNIVDKLNLDDAMGANLENLKVKNNYWTVTAAYIF